MTLFCLAMRHNVVIEAEGWNQGTKPTRNNKFKI